MKTSRPKAFVLIYVIVLTALTGSALLILTRVSNLMTKHSNILYTAACARNLKASGYAWAQYHSPHLLN